MFKETKTRSIIKTITWRVTATLTTTLLVLAFTGKLGVALTVGGLEAVAKLILFFFHERLWDRMNYGKVETKPAVLWFTGLSGSGKSTISERVYEEMRKMKIKVDRLDGDSVRNIFPKTGFTKSERDEHIKRVGFLASRLERNGIFVIASFISPYSEARNFVRNLCNNFVEIYIATSLEECERRDAKGLYSKARRGEIKNFTGVNDPYEKPENPEIIINTKDQTVDESVKIVMNYIKKHISN